jgi:hypothetical protein
MSLIGIKATLALLQQQRFVRGSASRAPTPLRPQAWPAGRRSPGSRAEIRAGGGPHFGPGPDGDTLTAPLPVRLGVVNLSL